MIAFHARSRDVVQSVLATNVTNLYDFDKRIHAVEQFRKLNEAESLAASNKRVANIIAKTNNDVSFNESLLKEDAEKCLYSEISKISSEVTSLYENNDYTGALSKLSLLKESIDQFFDQVMVNCEDEDVKNNRIALLKILRGMFTHIADISLLQK